ncbi:hypothetical protein CYMTET_49027 [Cymbomonas tetramitiformis]|uniref:VWFA domain-containing protein n=1 Tax=Cymbomonas tetramitiformis TaxID=36881 RepID=A0AAE0BQY8_9CHLO|nr:hypothetical protein CYMTET_49027 [Cymbomonas tetramitiformis]
MRQAVHLIHLGERCGQDLKRLISEITHVTCDTYQCDVNAHTCSLLPPGSSGEFTNTSLRVHAPGWPIDTFPVHTAADGSVQVVSSEGAMPVAYQVSAGGLIAAATLAFGPVRSRPFHDFDLAMTTAGYAVLTMAKCEEVESGCSFASSTPHLQARGSKDSDIAMMRAAGQTLERSSVAVTPPHDTVPPVCDMPAEIMLVIDGSSSESRGNFSMMLGFSDELRRSFNVSSSTVHMGVVQFSAKGAGRVASSLTDDPAALSRVILSLEQSGGSTAIGEGIRMAQAELAQGRPTVKHVMILMTDGAENEGSNPLDAAYDAKSNGTEIIILGIGANVHLQALQSYATQPSSTHVYNPANFGMLKNYVEATVHTACNKYFACDNASKTCQPVGPGEEGVLIGQCLMDCGARPKPPTPSPPTPHAAVYLCSQSTFMCDEVKPGTPGSASKEVCASKCGHATPPLLIGQWRGIQISPGYISGELDLHFEASSYALKDTKGNISTGGVTATGYFSLQVLDSSSGNLRGILFSYDADGPETTTITMLIGKPGVINLPLSVRAGFSDPKYDTYMLGKCNHKAPTCNFSAAMP